MADQWKSYEEFKVVAEAERQRRAMLIRGEEELRRRAEQMRYELVKQFMGMTQAQILPPPPPPPPDPRPTPPLAKQLVAGPTVGWRWWNATMDATGAWLHPLGVQQPAWPAGRPAKAICTQGAPAYGGGRHDVPQAGCSCGFWAFKSDREVPSSYIKPDRTLVRGTVALWGRVIEHQEGYSAEYAYPVTLWLERP